MIAESQIHSSSNPFLITLNFFICFQTVYFPKNEAIDVTSLFVFLFCYFISCSHSLIRGESLCPIKIMFTHLYTRTQQLQSLLHHISFFLELSQKQCLLATKDIFDLFPHFLKYIHNILTTSQGF